MNNQNTSMNTDDQESIEEYEDSIGEHPDEAGYESSLPEPTFKGKRVAQWKLDAGRKITSKHHK